MVGADSSDPRNTVGELEFKDEIIPPRSEFRLVYVLCAEGLGRACTSSSLDTKATLFCAFSECSEIDASQ